MNRKEAIEFMKQGGKIRVKTWWHGRYLHIPGTSRIVTESGKDAGPGDVGFLTDGIFEHADDWEVYHEPKRLEAYGCAVWKNHRGTIFTAPINTDDTIDHSNWNEVTDPVEGFLEAVDQLGLTNES